MPACSCCAPKAARRGTVRWLASGIWKALRRHGSTRARYPKASARKDAGRPVRVSELGRAWTFVRAGASQAHTCSLSARASAWTASTHRTRCSHSCRRLCQRQRGGLSSMYSAGRCRSTGIARACMSPRQHTLFREQTRVLGRDREQKREESETEGERRRLPTTSLPDRRPTKLVGYNVTVPNIRPTVLTLTLTTFIVCVCVSLL